MVSRRPPSRPPSPAERLLATVGLAATLLLLALVASPSARRRLGEALAATGGGPAGAERARVARVVDGDTLELADGRAVRVLGIDTPETRNPGLTGPQPLGEAATARTAALVGGQVVSLETDVTDRDHYGRLLRHVWRGRTLLAEQLAAEGLGRAYTIPPDSRHAAAIRAAEARARAARRGLWGLARPTSLPIFGTVGP